MSKAKADEAGDSPKKKGKGKLMLIILAILLVGAGAGAGGYVLAGGGVHGKEDPNKPKLTKRGDESGAKTSEGGKDDGPKSDAPLAGKGLPDTPADPSGYQATYYKIEAPFTSNLKDSDSFVQLSLGIATYYDERVIQNVQAHEMALRSAVLLVLSEQDELILATPQGKELLQDQLTKAFNRTLREKTGFGGIDNVYFTSLVVQ